MKTKHFDSKDEWLDYRRGKITGSVAKDIISERGGKKKGFYQMIADRIATPSDEENPMTRGNRLEAIAIDRFEIATGKKVDRSLIMWLRDDNDQIALSPDGVINDTEAVEVKCLNSASHIEAYITQAIPKEYLRQAYQYFVVNDKLQTLHYIMFDPRIKSLEFFTFTMKREDVENEVQKQKIYLEQILLEVNEFVSNLTF